MVNTGKPSSGCKLCKVRRIKCDEAKPYCMKCRKVGRQCPGYTNPFEARIRDQTQAVIKRFKRMRGEDGLPADSNNSAEKETTTPSFKETQHSRRYVPAVTLALEGSPSGSEEDFDEQDDIFNLPPGVTISIEDRASCYFASQFILVPQSPAQRARWFPFIPTLLNRHNVPDCLTEAYKSASIIAFASQRRSADSTSLFWAQRHYLKAVRAVNEALQDPEQAKDDATLAAVMLLAFYEVRLLPKFQAHSADPGHQSLSSDSMTAYINHVKGAAMIVQLRGEDRLDTPESLSMFDMMRNTVFSLHCMPSGPDVPECSYLLRHVACKNSALADMNFQGSQIRHAIDRIFHACRTRADYAERGSARTRKVLEVLQRARALEARFAAFHDTQIPPGWEPRVVDWVPERREEDIDSCATYAGPVYGFDDLGIAIIHLTTWTCHLMLTTSIMRCKSWLAYPEDYRTQGGNDGVEYGEVAASASRRVSDMVAMLPFFCSFSGSGKDTGTATFACGDVSDAVKGATCQMVLWPLFAASASDFATPGERRFLRGRLRFFAEEVGLKQAKVFLEVCCAWSCIHKCHVMLIILQRELSSPSSDIEKDQGAGCGW